MSEIGRLVRAVRRQVRPRDRTRPVGTVYYRCEQCMMSARVTLAFGVVMPARKGVDDHRAAVPQQITCRFCGDDMILDETSFERDETIELVLPYLRVPSRRAGSEMAAAGRVEAQLVDEP